MDLGDGVFRTLRVENGEIVAFAAHLKKLQNDCEAIHIHPSCPSLEELKSYVQLNNAEEGIWRLKISVVAHERVDIRSWVEGKFFLSMSPYLSVNKRLLVGLYPDPFHRLNCKVKALSYLDQKTLFSWSQARGYDEVLTTNQEGFILEGAYCNVFWEEGEALCFVDRALPYYEGVTQEILMEESGKEIRFAKITPLELKEKKIFLCNALKGIVPADFTWV